MEKTCLGCNKIFNIPLSHHKRGQGKFCSLDCKYRNHLPNGHSDFVKQKIKTSRIGKKHSLATKQKMSNSRIALYLSGRRLGFKNESHRIKYGSVLNGFLNPMFGIRRYGENSPRWEGGKTKTNKLLRNSEKYYLWRWNVFFRDSWTCQNCLKVGGKLNAHHIKPFAKFNDLRFEISNGITLCNQCHRLTHKKERKVNETAKAK